MVKLSVMLLSVVASLISIFFVARSFKIIPEKSLKYLILAVLFMILHFIFVFMTETKLWVFSDELSIWINGSLHLFISITMMRFSYGVWRMFQRFK